MSTDSAIPTDGAWRERLLASLKDCGVQRSPRNAALHWIIAIAALTVLGVVSFVVNQLLNANFRTEGDRIVSWVIWIVWIAFAIFVLNRLRNRLLRNAWQSTAATAEDELARPDCRRPILYLRSFKLDDRMNERSWAEKFLGAYPSENAEQAMTRALRKTGPAIAIGRPEEQLPSLGAARFYVSHDRWQQKVADVTAEARFVVWATGVTEGLRWEISHLVATVPPEKVILWAHPQLLKLPPREREAEWGRFRTALGDVFPKPLPERIGEARFVYFTDGWAPHPVAPPKRAVPWFNPIRACLHSLLAVKAGPDDPPSRGWAARLGAAGVGLLLTALLAAVLAPTLPDHTYTSRENDRITSQYSNPNKYHEIGMVASVGLVVLTASLAWRRRVWWRRMRLVGVVGLAGVVLAIAVMALMDERQNTYERVSNDYRGAKMEYRDKESPPMKTTAYVTSHVVAPGAYVKLVLAMIVAAAALRFTNSAWSTAGDEPVASRLTAADVDYTAPGDDTFADLIGVGGAAVVWPRVAGFFVALALMKLLPPLIVDQAFSLLGLFWAALMTAAAAAAFRFLSTGIAPLAAAAAVTVVWCAVFPSDLRAATVGYGFAGNLALLAGLSWATRRMGPRPLAFWFGAMWAPVVVWLLRWFGGELPVADDRDFLTGLLAPVVFAAALETAVRLTPAPGQPLATAR